MRAVCRSSAERTDGFEFTESDIEYLAGLNAPGGGKLFKAKFLEYLQALKLSVDIDAVREGEVIFPMEPIVRVMGPILECQLLETALLNCVNFQTLIATKAARVCLAAKAPVAEFGLRRAQGAGGSLCWPVALRLSADAPRLPTCLRASSMYIPVSGTHSHSWVMSFDSELDAFRAYAKCFPTNCVLLVDTYNVKKGIENAITVGLEMRERGEKLAGIRIDSGDLAWLSRYARERLDAAGLTDCGIVLSNDLDEYTIEPNREQGANVMSWGVGTMLATAYDQPALGGVYKLSATKSQGDSKWKARLKVTEMSSKLTLPGVLDARRFFFEDGRIAGDMVFDVNEPVNAEDKIIDPSDLLRQKSLAGLASETLLRPLSRDGKSVLAAE